MSMMVPTSPQQTSNVQFGIGFRRQPEALRQANALERQAASTEGDSLRLAHRTATSGATSVQATKTAAEAEIARGDELMRQAEAAYDNAGTLYDTAVTAGTQAKTNAQQAVTDGKQRAEELRAQAAELRASHNSQLSDLISSLGDAADGVASAKENAFARIAAQVTPQAPDAE